MAMNKLPLAKRAKLLTLLCEGMSMRAIARTEDVSFNTVAKALIDAGTVCAQMHDELVHDVKAKRVQCDEIWAFNYCKQRTVATAKAAPEDAGDIWTWTGIDADSKLIISYLVGDRSGQAAIELMDDIRSRLTDRVQISTDGHRAYLEAVEGAFGGDVDYGMLVKIYGEAPGPKGRYSPAECIGARKDRIEGDPDPKFVSTSHVERMNLSIRMQNRRFTRLTNAFSKKLDNHIHALALYFCFYNFCRMHKSLRMSPAMAAGVSQTLWTMEDIAEKIEARTTKPAKRGPYKKRVTA